jgi:hypothetical protein
VTARRAFWAAAHGVTRVVATYLGLAAVVAWAASEQASERRAALR